MTKYAVTLGVVASVTVVAEGETLQDAIENAIEQTELPCLCEECGRKMTVEEFSDEVNVAVVQ